MEMQIRDKILYVLLGFSLGFAVCAFTIWNMYEYSYGEDPFDSGEVPSPEIRFRKSESVFSEPVSLYKIVFDVNSEPLLIGRLLVRWMEGDDPNWSRGFSLQIGTEHRAMYDAIIEEFNSPARDIRDFKDLLNALWFAESGQTNPWYGPGDEIGSFQITKKYVDEVNRINLLLGVSRQYSYEDRKMIWCSQDMVGIKLHYHEAKTSNRNYDLYDTKCFERMARIHNGGPDGWRDDPNWFVCNRGYTLEEANKKIANTKTYWRKVEKFLNEQE